MDNSRTCCRMSDFTSSTMRPWRWVMRASCRTPRPYSPRIIRCREDSSALKVSRARIRISLRSREAPSSTSPSRPMAPDSCLSRSRKSGICLPRNDSMLRSPWEPTTDRALPRARAVPATSRRSGPESVAPRAALSTGLRTSLAVLNSTSRLRSRSCTASEVSCWRRWTSRKV